MNLLKNIQRIVAIGSLCFCGFILQKSFFPINPYKLNFTYHSAEGIHVGSYVFLKGVKVGRIIKMELDTESYDVNFVILITAKNLVIYDNFVLRINKNLLLGRVSLEIEPQPIDQNAVEDHALYSGDQIRLVKGTVIESVFNDFKPIVVSYIEKHKDFLPEDLKNLVRIFFQNDSARR